ncbi:tRNA (N6-threonylcarbamoyladenosine(37)-N6)-methyltransferase TrmO [Anaerosacchariphilus polymeriproducens]|uniref:tRNA (N6-threonylcarbamoyladenosine(37)-N6)-methyltransferase TrmO n=1 Tax=Anaerosacchariphilus polymeriproducens TaxID=1812858 RepID=A0A371AWX0_9FIRM|nr:tRNA (N6-threonylcarbamoyladenosine(37)-N6)-methyltransferase TrmO [Anaerosacchariphilus polymeriproducens]RDU24041.1 tRNA (N6-threonylcarbamoyladenosine(37)-N6)-methyltransferase TrmO [Anaerosacchariphilus polymeriproducens]
MKEFKVRSIGTIRINKEGMFVELDENYLPALKELEGFSHLNVIWWFHEFDSPDARSILETDSPYCKGPKNMGIFATRSPIRPNPVALSVGQILKIDYEKGRIQLAYIDANDGTPVIDLKPYTPSLDRVEAPKVPQWCQHWPSSIEKSGEFDWENEFNF